MRLSTGAFEETFPEGDRPRFRSRMPNATGTGAHPARAPRRSPETLPVIRPDNGSSGREVPDLLRSLLNLFAERGAFVTGFLRETDLSLSCHRPGAASKYQTGERNAPQKQTESR